MNYLILCQKVNLSEKLNAISGNINEDLTFEYGDGTQTYNGCAATFQNEFWYFGGNERQVKRFYL